MKNLLDEEILKERLQCSYIRYQTNEILSQEIAQRALSRLEYIKIKPFKILHAGTRNNFSAKNLQKYYPQSQITLVDSVATVLKSSSKRSWWKRWPACCGEAPQLPFANHSFDFIFSNLWLTEYNDLQKVIAEFVRVLKPNSLLLFTLLGPDTLKELRQSFAEDNHVHSFLDMHDVGDLLQKSQLADPVMDMEYLTLMYSSVNKLLQELKSVGASNVRRDRDRGLMGKQRWQDMLNRYENLRTAQGIPATVEVIYGHAWTAEKKFQRQENNEVSIPVTEIKRGYKSSE